jgi:hypothetical protein
MMLSNCQMKFIGELLGKRASVRSQVSPNSQTMKAIQVIFKRPGVTPAKACIMCAGPDWPVSVICGMLRLSYLQTSLGLGPVFLFTVPAVLAGAFMTKLPSSGLGGMETLAMIVLLLMNMLFSLGMMFLTNKVITQEKEALAAIPDDVEVKQADEANARATAARREATKFAAMPNGVRALLVTSTVMRVVSAYALFFVPSRLFQPFAITDCSDTLGANSPYTSFLGKSLGASWLGVMALGLLVLTILLGQVYGMWYAPCQTGALATRRALARTGRSHARSARTHRALARTGRSPPTSALPSAFRPPCAVRLDLPLPRLPSLDFPGAFP